MNADNNKRKLVNFRLPRPLIHRFDKITKDLRITRTAVLEEIIEAFIQVFENRGSGKNLKEV